MALRNFRAPALPLPGPEYDRRQMDEILRALRLYFNLIDSLTPIESELFVGGGWGLRLPHIAASDSTDQFATANNTPTVVTWDTLDSGFGWALNPPGSATADYAGVYKITYSLQFINTANAAHYADVWLKVNNVDVPNSTTKFFIPARKSGSDFAYICAYSEVTFEVNVGDEIELYWATDLKGTISPAVDGVYMFHDAAQTTPYARPAIPSAIGSITFVSAPVV